MKKNRKFSLKTLLTLLVTFCWIMPIVIVLTSLSYYSNSQMRKSVLEELSILGENAIALSQQNLQSVIDSSKKATYDGEIKDIYKEFILNNDNLNLYRGTSSYLNTQYQYNDLIEETLLVYHITPKDNYFVNNYKSSYKHSISNILLDLNKDTLLQISGEINTSIKFLVIDNNLYMLRNIVDSNFDPFALLVMKLNCDEIFKSIYSMPLTQEAQVVIDGYTLNLTEISPKIDYEIQAQNSNIHQIDNSYYMYTNDFILDSHLNGYRILLNTDILKDNTLSLNIIITLLMILILPLVSLVIYIFFKHFSIPVTALIHSASRIENGDFGYQIKREPKSVEMAYLTQRFNQMSLSMKDQIDLIFTKQEALQNAKIKALQSQINPHFLNNTLEVINWELRLGENQNAIEMIESLSIMLNASMAKNENPLKHLKEELLYVDAYLHIISTRMGKRLTIIREIDQEVTDIQVPLLILQPIVENAIEHGIANRSTGVLTIRAFEDKEDVVIEVENDSPLSDEDKKRIDILLNWDGNQSTEHIGYSSLGIRNVNQRLKLIFGDSHCLTITSTENNSTLSQIRFPKEQI